MATNKVRQHSSKERQQEINVSCIRQFCETSLNVYNTVHLCNLLHNTNELCKKKNNISNKLANKQASK